MLACDIVSNQMNPCNHPRFLDHVCPRLPIANKRYCDLPRPSYVLQIVIRHDSKRHVRHISFNANRIALGCQGWNIWSKVRFQRPSSSYVTSPAMKASSEWVCMANAHGDRLYAWKRSFRSQGISTYCYMRYTLADRYWRGFSDKSGRNPSWQIFCQGSWTA